VREELPVHGLKMTSKYLDETLAKLSQSSSGLVLGKQSFRAICDIENYSDRSVYNDQTHRVAHKARANISR
jgi:hypothetical protein